MSEQGRSLSVIAADTLRDLVTLTFDPVVPLPVY